MRWKIIASPHMGEIILPNVGYQYTDDDDLLTSVLSFKKNLWLPPFSLSILIKNKLFEHQLFLPLPPPLSYLAKDIKNTKLKKEIWAFKEFTK